MQEYVAGFLFRKNNSQVALVEKQKPEWQRGFLNGIGGKIEESDWDILSAMQREFKEETGADVDDWKLFAELKGKDWIVYFSNRLKVIIKNYKLWKANIFCGAK